MIRVKRSLLVFVVGNRVNFSVLRPSAQSGEVFNEKHTKNILLKSVLSFFPHFAAKYGVRPWGLKWRSSVWFVTLGTYILLYEYPLEFYVLNDNCILAIVVGLGMVSLRIST